MNVYYTISDFCSESDYVRNDYLETDNLRLYFFARLVDEDTFKEIELNALKAKEYGLEVMINLNQPI